MLQHIRVRNYAIIDEVDLELVEGLTVLTGETGAGKSILVDALGLVLGDRSDATAVRHGAERAEITATFDLSDRPEACRWLEDQEMDADGECVLRRVISREGRSRAYVNGGPVTLQALRSLGEMLVEIHGQHEHQTLTRRPVQRDLLDTFGGHEKLVAEVSESFENWEAKRRRLEALRYAQDDRDNRLDLLHYQVRELEGLALEDGEFEQLQSECLKLSNVERLAGAVAGAHRLVYEDESGSAQQRLAQARQALDSVIDLDPALDDACRLIQEAEIQTTEAAEDLRRYLADLEVDPQRQEQVAARLNVVRELSRKHQVEPARLGARLQSLQTELENLEKHGLTLEELEAAQNKAMQECLEASGRLTRRRHAAAVELSEAITAAMHQLGMPGGCFEVKVDTHGDGALSRHGLDNIEFLVSANPGQPTASLAKVASGGELSRISLAVQVTASRSSERPCLVFDEVDAGIGGATAEIVGRKLRQLGEGRQALCVTHLPQVASQSHQHVRVAKLTDGQRTRTTLTTLGAGERVEELARMLGGVKITTTSRRHAEEMIDAARKSG
ncbi:MAG: DNA repair protein RecN [Gammaproteobacteria bacterium]|nr:MAG: DNA repair protein RecN [Gammaproteobacteria bacterium]